MPNQETATVNPIDWLSRAEEAGATLAERVEALAGAIDSATDLKNLEALQHADVVAKTLIAESPESPVAAELAYMRANAWSARRHICKVQSDDEWDWEGEEIEREILHLREAAYRRWCLHHRLFLNPLNDLGPLSVADHDVLTTPDFVTALKEPPSPVRFFNVMKQEYVSARFMLFEGSRSEDVHFSDRGVLLYNTLDYPSHSLAVERIKCAFRATYSLFDKIGQFINYYWRLGIAPDKVTLRWVWYEARDKRQRKLRTAFRRHPNWPLRGLCWLSRDLFDPRPGFRDHTDPNAQALDTVRNRMEHGFLAVHEFEALYATVGAGLPEDHPLQADRNLYAISRRELTAKTLRLLQLARAALIYLSLAMHTEERRRASDRSGNGGIVPMDLGTWDDEWKR